MKIEVKKVTVRALVSDYRDDGEGGVVGCDGKLDIRPPFQREFVYKDKQRAAVVRTVMRGLPTQRDVLGGPRGWQFRDQ